MKKILFVTIVLFIAVVNGLAQDNLKIISYNIWNGYDWGKDTERREKLLNWMNQRKPDVVALQELCAYTDKKLKADASAWGHDYSILLKTSGYSVGLSSKYPIVLKEKIMDGMHHGALHCQTNGIEVFVVHLSPFQWKKRNEEADILIQRIGREIEAGNQVIVCGDFNALSPIDTDWYNSKVQLLENSRGSDQKHEHVENLREGNFCYTAMSKFYAAGLYDVCPAYVEPGNERISCPTQVFAKKEEDKQRLIEEGSRIDYILTSYNLVDKCISASIFNGYDTYYLSDHYPVEAVFELK